MAGALYRTIIGPQQYTRVRLCVCPLALKMKVVSADLTDLGKNDPTAASLNNAQSYLNPAAELIKFSYYLNA